MSSRGGNLILVTCWATFTTHGRSSSLPQCSCHTILCSSSLGGSWWWQGKNLPAAPVGDDFLEFEIFHPLYLFLSYAVARVLNLPWFSIDHYQLIFWCWGPGYSGHYGNNTQWGVKPPHCSPFYSRFIVWGQCYSGGVVCSFEDDVGRINVRIAILKEGTRRGMRTHRCSASEFLIRADETFNLDILGFIA